MKVFCICYLVFLLNFFHVLYLVYLCIITTYTQHHFPSFYALYPPSFPLLTLLSPSLPLYPPPYPFYPSPYPPPFPPYPYIIYYLSCALVKVESLISRFLVLWIEKELVEMNPNLELEIKTFFTLIALI